MQPLQMRVESLERLCYKMARELQTLTEILVLDHDQSISDDERLKKYRELLDRMDGEERGNGTSL